MPSRKYPTPIYVVSYPKAGRTWVKFLVNHYMRLHYHISERLKKEHFLINEKMWEHNHKMPLLRFSHSLGENLAAWIGKSEDIENQCNIFRKNKVILLVRNPLDIIVSSYFHKTKRVPKDSNEYINCTIKEYIHSDVGNIDCIIRYYNIWLENIDIPKEFLMVKYEDLKIDTASELNKILFFIGFIDIEQEYVNKSVRYSSLKNIRKSEIEDYYKKNIVELKDVNDEESFKARRGKVNGYVDYLDKDDIKYLQDKVNSQLTDELKCYKRN